MDAFDNLAETSAWKAFSTCVLIRNIQKTFPGCYGEKFNIIIHLRSLTKAKTGRRTDSAGTAEHFSNWGGGGGGG